MLLPVDVFHGCNWLVIVMLAASHRQRLPGSGRNEWKIFFYFLWRNFSLISEVDVYIVDCPESS
jgi:hypothetical protein